MRRSSVTAVVRVKTEFTRWENAPLSEKEREKCRNNVGKSYMSVTESPSNPGIAQ